MTCDEARLTLFALLDDELDVARSLEVLAHLETCAACRAEAERDDRLTVLLQKHLSPGPAAPLGLWERVTARIHAEEGRQRDRLPFGTRRLLAGVGTPWRPWRVAQVAALALIVIVALVMLVPLRPAASFLAEEIMADHLGSLSRAGGPVDLVTTDPSAVVTQFRAAVHVPDTVPVLQHADSKLLGGSYCQLQSTKGIRFTYALGATRTVSVYQLERPREAVVPAPGGRPLYIGYVEGSPRPGAILWGDERFVYALVGDMPPTALEQLAQTLLPHRS
jgi:anti-sigma factor RsiW